MRDPDDDIEFHDTIRDWTQEALDEGLADLPPVKVQVISVGQACRGHAQRVLNENDITIGEQGYEDGSTTWSMTLPLGGGERAQRLLWDSGLGWVGLEERELPDDF